MTLRSLTSIPVKCMYFTVAEALRKMSSIGVRESLEGIHAVQHSTSTRMMLAGREVEKGKVLFFAGENDTEAAKHGPFSLLIVDSSAAYYSGDDENDTVQLGNHARLLRSFVDLPGGPTILVLCHPIKNANKDNLLPRGAGAFLAEIDGNLVCQKENDSMVVEIGWHGKFRGPDFASFAFKLIPGKSDKLVDSKGRKVWTVTAEPISDADQEVLEQAGHRNENELLRLMLAQPGLSMTDLAKKLGWTTVGNEPNKRYVQRMLNTLKADKMVKKGRHGHYILTNEGEREAEKLPPWCDIETVVEPTVAQTSKVKF